MYSYTVEMRHNSVIFKFTIDIDTINLSSHVCVLTSRVTITAESSRNGLLSSIATCEFLWIHRTRDNI